MKYIFLLIIDFIEKKLIIYQNLQTSVILSMRSIMFQWVPMLIL